MPPLRTIWFALISLSYSILLFGTAMLGFKLTTQNETGWGAACLPFSLAILSLLLTIMSLMLPIVGALLLGNRAWDLYQQGREGTQVTLAGMMALTSIYVFVSMMLIRPKKEAEPSTMDREEQANAIGQ